MTALERCRWPKLGPRYDRALRAAVEFILERFEAQGIIAAGSIVAGNPGPSSDLDLYVIHEKPLRQRIQQWFEGVPAEIFVNPPAMVRQYFAEERYRPCTANMLATGFMIWAMRRSWRRCAARPGLAGATVRRAAEQLTMRRYLAADAYDNAQDIAEQPGGACAFSMGQWTICCVMRFWPRPACQRGVPGRVSDSIGVRRAGAELLSCAARRRAAWQSGCAVRHRRDGLFAWESTPEAVTVEPDA